MQLGWRFVFTIFCCCCCCCCTSNITFLVYMFCVCVHRVHSQSIKQSHVHLCVKIKRVAELCNAPFFFSYSDKKSFSLSNFFLLFLLSSNLLCYVLCIRLRLHYIKILINSNGSKRSEIDEWYEDAPLSIFLFLVSSIWLCFFVFCFVSGHDFDEIDFFTSVLIETCRFELNFDVEIEIKS